MSEINPAILKIIEELRWDLHEGPVAMTWDREYERYFESIGITTESRDSMYTSVHYVIRPNSESEWRCEVQVRTISEELWGEVSHQIDYPQQTPSIACAEQLKVLARLTSGSTRLVDAIFKSQHEHRAWQEKKLEPKKRKR